MQDKKREALERMKMLRIHENAIAEFEKEGRLNCSERGILFWLDESKMKVVKDFEEQYGGMVYHAILSRTNIGEMLSLLYVSKHKEEWELERGDISENCPLAYVYNFDAPDLSELGSIGVKPLFGGVERIF